MIENMAKDKSLADLLFQVLITCGTNESVLSVAAIKPMIVTNFIFMGLKCWEIKLQSYAKE